MVSRFSCTCKYSGFQPALFARVQIFCEKTNFGVFGVRARGRFLRVRAGRIAGGALWAKLRADFARSARSHRGFSMCLCGKKNYVRRAGLWSAREVFLRSVEARIGEIGRCDFFSRLGICGFRASGFARGGRAGNAGNRLKNRSICRENSGNIETLRKWEQGL